MNILVIGRHGQVARCLEQCAEGRGDTKLKCIGRPEVDLEVEGSLARAIDGELPDLIINAAAYTAVDHAEKDERRARRINAEAAGEGARAATGLGIPFIYLSTDYVFDGSVGRAWREDDPIAPINTYGLTKAEGERHVEVAGPQHTIIRTSWVVSPFGHNFVKTVLRLTATQDEIAVVDDQRGCPTSALNLADALLEIGHLAIAGQASGIYHLAGAGEASWAELAEHIVQCKVEAGGRPAKVLRIRSSEYPTQAPRPANSVLDCAKARTELGIVLPPWRDSVSKIVRVLVQ